jgi:hypothetical protein
VLNKEEQKLVLLPLQQIHLFQMGRSPCCDKVGLKKGPWTPEEDQKLLAYIEEHGHGSWRALPTKAGDLHFSFVGNTSNLLTLVAFNYPFCVL